MPRNTFSIGQRSFKHNSLFALAAAAISLTLTAAPAFAQAPEQGMERVEVRGRVVEAPARFDVSASCDVAADRVQDELHKAWWHANQYGEMNVQFVVDGGEVIGVRTRGMSMDTMQAVRKAVRRMECPNAGSGTHIYRMQVVFVDPDARGATVAAGPADGVYRLALAGKR